MYGPYQPGEMQTIENVEAHIADAVKKGVTGITGVTRVAAFSFRLVISRQYCALAMVAQLAAILSKFDLDQKSKPDYPAFARHYRLVECSLTSTTGELPG